MAIAVPAMAFGAYSLSAGENPAHRPDAWAKLCGDRNTCLLHPWHPWRGKDVHNTTGVSQVASGAVEQGVMIRFWILLQNDGTSSETLKLDGCAGTSVFQLIGVNVGAWRAGTEQNDITAKFKAGTATFAFPPSSTDHAVIVSVRFKALSSPSGVTYSCPVVLSSSAAPTVKDKVILKMTTV
jgi:hypothetical protein